MVVLWIILLVISGDISTLAQRSSIIETYPSLLNSTIVTGYEGLQLTVRIQSGVYEGGCRWYYGEMFEAYIYFIASLQCINGNGKEYTLACDITNNVITSNLTILIPTRESVTVRVECQPDRAISTTATLAFLNLNVKDCSTIPPLVVNSRLATYNSSGNFSCTNNGSLFYSNETQITSTQTTCLATAEWSGQNGLECWNAPSNVNIIGNLTVLEGHDVSLTCSYTEGFPVMTNLSFNVNNEKIEEQNFQATLNRNDHKKPVYCQANNRFTEIVDGNSNDGRSPAYRFNVLYAPFQNSSDDCNLFSETDQDNKDCEVVFYSNPNATFVAVIDATSGIELNSSRKIIIDGTSGKHTYKYSGFENTNVSSSTTYYLNVSIPEVPPFIHSIPFTVNIDIPTTTTATIPVTVTGDEGGGDATIIIVVVVLAVALVFALVVIIVCWRLRQKQLSSLSSKRQENGKPVKISMNSRRQQTETKSNDPKYLTIDDSNQDKIVYEQIGEYENVNVSSSASNQQQLKEGEYVNASTTPYINLNLAKQTSFPSKPESDYETMNPQVVTKE